MWERRGHYITITFPLKLQDILNIPLLVPILLYLQQHFSCSENLKETWVIKIVRRWKTLAWKLEKLRKLDTSLYKSTTYFILYYCSRYKTCKVRIDLIMIPTRWERELQEKNVDIIRLKWFVNFFMSNLFSGSSEGFKEKKHHCSCSCSSKYQDLG